MNLRTDRQRYWTRAPGPRRLEGVCVLAALLATIAIQLGAMMGNMGAGMGQGFILAVGLVVGSILFETARSVTNRQLYADPGFFWYGIPFFLGSMAFVDLGLRLLGEAQVFYSTSSFLRLVAYGVGGLGLSLAFSSLRFWRRRWIGAQVVRRAHEIGLEDHEIPCGERLRHRAGETDV